MYVRKGLHVVMILWVALELFGCAWFQTKEEKTAQELADQGTKASMVLA